MIRTYVSSLVKLMSMAVNHSYCLKPLHMATFYIVIEEWKQIAYTQTAVLQDAVTWNKSFT